MSNNLRPSTSPIDFEPLPLALDDIIYPELDEEEPLEEQEAQGRRIQLQAQHYLQGGQLFILSAQLRGPFGAGWVNPWTGRRKRKERNDGLGVGNGKMPIGGDTTGGGGQEDKLMTIPETRKPSIMWLNRDNAIWSEISETRSNSPTPTPAMKPPGGTLSTMTKLDPCAEDLQGCLKFIPPSKNLLAFEYSPLIRKDKGCELQFEKSKARAKAQVEMFRSLNFTPAIDVQKLKSKSGSLGPQNHEDSPARRLQEFTRKRREINQADNLIERDDKSRVISSLLPVLFSKPHSVEGCAQPEAIPSQNSPRKRRRREEENVHSYVDGASLIVKRPLGANNTNKEIISTQAMIDAASPFKVSDYGTSSPISSTKSKPSLFSAMKSSGMSASGRLNNEYGNVFQQRPQLQPRGLGESGFDLKGAVNETLQFLKASRIENEMRMDTNP